MYIYKTTNLVNGRIYIGQHAGKKKNYLGSGVILTRAIKKYGKDKFKTEIIEECSTLEELAEREKYWIKYFGSRDRNIGYNITLGGEQTDMIKKKREPNRYTRKNYTKEEWSRNHSRQYIHFSEEEAEKVRKLYCEDKLTIREIGNILGISHATVSREMKAFNIEIEKATRHTIIKRPPKTKEDIEKYSASVLKRALKKLNLENEEELKDLVVHLYLEEEMSLGELRKYLCIGNKRIRLILAERGITQRTLGECVKITWKQPVEKQKTEGGGFDLDSHKRPKREKKPKIIKEVIHKERKKYTEAERREKYGRGRISFSEAEKEKVRVLYCIEGKTMEEISKILGISASVVFREMHECGIEIIKSRPSKTKGIPRSKETKEKSIASKLNRTLKNLGLKTEEDLKNLVVYLYVEKETPLKRIKESLHISDPHVKLILKERGITLRTRSVFMKIAHKQALTRQKKDLP